MQRFLYLAIIVFLAVGCGGPGRQPAEQSMLHRGNGEEPESLDIHKSNSTEAGHVQRDLGEGLTGYTPDGELVPRAAESWTLSEDGTEYLFKLRADAQWSNGDPVTAAYFVDSYRRLVKPETAALYTDSVNSVRNAKAILAGEADVETLGVEAEGPLQLRITLEQPVPYFLGLLAHPSMFPVHTPSVKQHGDLYARPGNLVSNGAYRLVDWQLGDYIEIERNEYYWNNAGTAIDRVRHYVTPEPMAELNRYRAGELHITRTIPPEMFASMQASRPAEVRVSPALGVYYYGFNLTDPRLGDNPKLREALSMAIDRETIVQLTGRGEAPAYSWVPPGTANYDTQRYTWSDLPVAERHRRAQQLFSEAGFGPDRLPDLEVRYNTHDTHRQLAVAIQSMWKDVLGFEARLVNEDFQVLLANVQDKNTEIFRLNWNGDYNDGHTFLAGFETGNSSNFTGYASEEFDELMARAAAQRDPGRRKLYLEEAERRMLRDYPVIPIYFYINRNMVSPEVRGWGDNVLNYHYSQHLSLVTEE
jgi:ABC-type oligopeptide transport system substrate-binding subunit